ncbi:MAG: hypothetical protein U5L11_08305 [Arhodomonas sp.]|nr:hypothetical protein [Arhodomonas sp.]
MLVLDDEGELGVEVDDDGVVVFHPVEVVRAEREGFWVAGLPQGVRVIAVGQGFVREGGGPHRRRGLTAGAGLSMAGMITATFWRSRTALLLLVMILLLGANAYVNIPKEAEPDVAIPIIYVSVGHEGVSPDDAERLLARPPWRPSSSLIEGLEDAHRRRAGGYAAVIAGVRCRLRRRRGPARRAREGRHRQVRATACRRASHASRRSTSRCSRADRGPLRSRRPSGPA